MARQVRGPETGGDLPRAGSATADQAGIIAGMLALFVIAPPALPVAIVTVFAVIRQRRWHWYEIAAVALLATFAVGAVVQVVTGSLLTFHFGGWSDAFLAGGSWIAALGRTAVVGIPLGVTAGAGYVGLAEFANGRAEFHPIEQRRRAVDDVRSERRISAALDDRSGEVTCSALPLGVLRGGDLGDWTEGRYAVPPPGKFPAMGLLGESGSGKTVTAERLVEMWARAGRKVIFADFKGTDPELAVRVVAAYKAARPEAACALWPAQPLDMWRGSPVEIANRLLCVQDFSEPYYKAVAETAVRLAMLAPDVDGTGPVTDSDTFLQRLDKDFLERAYEGRREAIDVKSVTRKPEALDGVRLRYSGFFSALAGRLDHGFSFEDADLAVLSVPALAARSDAMAVARMVLADFGAYCVSRKPREGEDVTFIVDEFSAVTDAAPIVIDLAERVRDVGGQVVVSAQSYEGLGRDDAERRRMIGSLAPGGLVVHRLSDPDEVLKVAGTVRAVEQSWQLDDRGTSGMGSAKMAHKMRVDPDAVRQARTGEAWVVTRGRAAHVSVIRTRIDAETADHAEALVNFARMQAAEDLAMAREPEVRPWWEVKVLARPRRAELEAPGLAELVAGPGLPPMLPPVPDPIRPDPRLVLAIYAYVRAGLITRAQRIAERTKGIKDPEQFVDRAVAKRRRAIERARGDGRRRTG